MSASDPVKDILLVARAKVARGWTRHIRAADITGKGVGPHTPRACAHCLVGAVDFAVGLRWSNERYMDGNKARALLRAQLPARFKSLSSYNDARGRTSAHILALFDGAIAARTVEMLLREKR